MLDWVQPVLDWVARHPGWAIAFIFLASLGDALILVGLFIPSTVVMFGVGALVALGSVDFSGAILAAATGAILGDSIMFTIGWRYGAAAMRVPLAARYAEAIATSRRFFDRHGIKSLLLARFAGLGRIVPAIAGAHRLSPLRVAFVILVSGVAWAFVFMLPGIAVGASLGLAAEVASRLAVLLLAMVVMVWLLIVLTSMGVRFMQGHAQAWIEGLLDWSHRHRRVGRLGEWLADPGQPETPALLILALILLVAGSLWLVVWWGLGRNHPLPLDATVFLTLKELHTPWGVALAGALAQLGSAAVTWVVAVSVVLTLLAWREPRAALHALAAILFAAVISVGLHSIVRLPDPLQYYAGDLRARFSGNDLMLAASIYGLIPVLLSTGRPPQERTVYYGFAIALLALIGGAQLYLGEQWFSVGVFALVVGGLWVAVLAVGYRRHHPHRIPARNLLVPVVVVASVAIAVLSPDRGSAGDAAPAEPPQRGELEPKDWRSGGYRRLPAYRSDMAGLPRYPFNVQWAGSLEDIDLALKEAGWDVPVQLRPTTMLRWLAPGSTLAELPVLPQVHAGQHHSLIVSKPADAAGRRNWVLRLWPSGWRLRKDPIWLGSLSLQRPLPLLGFAQVPLTQLEFNQPMAALEEAPPPAFRLRRVRHATCNSAPMVWDCGIWLVYPKGSA